MKFKSANMQAGGAAAPQPPSAMPAMLPEDARYGRKTSFLRSKRVWNTFYPQNGGDYGPAAVRTIRFDLLSDKFLDISELRFCCSGTFNADNGSAVNKAKSLESGLGGTIERVTISTPGGTVIERIDQYGLIQCILNQVESGNAHDAARLAQEEMFNSTNSTISDTEGAMPAGAYTAFLAHRFHTGFNRPKDPKLLPPNSPFRIEIELVSDAAKCMTTYGGTPAATDNVSFLFSNCEIRCPSVEIMNDAFMDSARRMMMSGWRYSGSQYKAYNHSAPTTLTNTPIIVPDASVCMTGILALSTLSASIDQPHIETIFDHEVACWQGTGNNSQQAFVGSDVYPKAPYHVNLQPSATNATQPTNMRNDGVIQQVVDILGALPSGFSTTGFAGNMGLLGFAIGERQGAGVDTASTSTPVQLRLSSGSTNTANASRVITTIVQKTAIYSLAPSPDGMIQISSVA
jgi:hypothetical protein